MLLGQSADQGVMPGNLYKRQELPVPVTSFVLPHITPFPTQPKIDFSY